MRNDQTIAAPPQYMQPCPNGAKYEAEGKMKDRDCETCVHAHPFGGENDNRCDAWECDYINRKEAIEAYKARREKESR